MDRPVERSPFELETGNANLFHSGVKPLGRVVMVQGDERSRSKSVTANKRQLEVRTDSTHEQLRVCRVDGADLAEFARPAERKPQEVNPPPVPVVSTIAVKVFDVKQEAAVGHAVILFTSTIGHRGKPLSPLSWRPLRQLVRSFHRTRKQRGAVR